MHVYVWVVYPFYDGRLFLVSAYSQGSDPKNGQFNAGFAGGVVRKYGMKKHVETALGPGIGVYTVPGLELVEYEMAWDLWQY